MPEPQPTRFRLFVALTLPEPVKARLLEVQDTLRKAVPDGPVRWAGPEQLHLTLRFLGSIEAVQVSALEESLLAACRPFDALRLQAANIGFFPRPRSPRVVWAGVSDQGNFLQALQEAVEHACAGFTMEAPEKRFTGHVTLGRIKQMRPSDSELLTAAAARLSSVPFGDWVASEVHLIRSQLSPTGARYSVVKAFPLHSAH